MTQTETKNKLLPIFYNYKETADALPKKHRGEFWELVINYAFDGENAIKDDLEHCNKYVKIAFLSIKNLLKLNKKAGSQNGKSNNPSGLSKIEEPNIGANIGANITPIPYIKENKINEDKIREDNIPPVSKDTVPQRVTRFQKPTIDEIRVYCSERNNGINAESFYDFYESKGWKVGSSPMKDWKSAVRNWERRRTNPQKTTQAEEVFNHNFAHLQSLFDGGEDVE